jgi:hypothetical protein
MKQSYGCCLPALTRFDVHCRDGGYIIAKSIFQVHKEKEKTP